MALITQPDMKVQCHAETCKLVELPCKESGVRLVANVVLVALVLCVHSGMYQSPAWQQHSALSEGDPPDGLVSHI